MTKYLLAMHSTSETLGIAVQEEGESTQHINTFNVGKKLSNNLFKCINTMLPSKNWKKLTRLAVAIGPGGFTGTRLTVVMARTLAQQLNCPLDGVSSFSLMAARLSPHRNGGDLEEAFWIVKSLPRRGIVGGKYKIVNKTNEVLELEIPHLLAPNIEVNPSIQADEDVEADVGKLLETCKKNHELKYQSNWGKVLPIYPTSPVGQI